jgi:hypothetical protein
MLCVTPPTYGRKKRQESIMPIAYELWVEEEVPDDAEKAVITAAAISHNLAKQSGLAEKPGPADESKDNELVVGREFATIKAHKAFRAQISVRAIDTADLHFLLRAHQFKLKLKTSIVVNRVEKGRKLPRMVAQLECETQIDSYVAPLREWYHFNFKILDEPQEDDYDE